MHEHSPEETQGYVPYEPEEAYPLSNEPLLLREWLISTADISERYIDKIVSVLDEQEVDSVHDLQLLTQLPIWQLCGLSSLTKMKIE